MISSQIENGRLTYLTLYGTELAAFIATIKESNIRHEDFTQKHPAAEKAFALIIDSKDEV